MPRSMTLIQELTITDDVTGLFNARHLYTLLDEQVAQGQVFSLMFVDLDHFKSVNDTHGPPYREPVCSQKSAAC